jgi:predicted transcriptional regulator
MTAKESINPNIPTVTAQDTASKVLEWMDDFKVDQLPYTESGKYLGLVKRNTLELLLDEESILEGIELYHSSINATENQHFFEALSLAGEYLLEVVPVLNSEKEYLGAINMRDVATMIAKSFAVNSIGSIFTLSIEGIHYSLAEISRIVESNNARVLSSFVEIDKDSPSKLLVTLKVNTKELKFILATFERFNYHIVAHYLDDTIEDGSKERLGILLKYLEI